MPIENRTPEAEAPGKTTTNWFYPSASGGMRRSYWLLVSSVSSSDADPHISVTFFNRYALNQGQSARAGELRGKKRKNASASGKGTLVLASTDIV